MSTSLLCGPVLLCFCNACGQTTYSLFDLFLSRWPGIAHQQCSYLRHGNGWRTAGYPAETSHQCAHQCDLFHAFSLPAGVQNPRQVPVIKVHLVKSGVGDTHGDNLKPAPARGQLAVMTLCCPDSNRLPSVCPHQALRLFNGTAAAPLKRQHNGKCTLQALLPVVLYQLATSCAISHL